MVVYRRSSRRRTVIALLVLTAVTLITLDQRSAGGGVAGAIRHGVHDVIAPVQSAADSVFTPVGDWFDGVFNAGDLKTQNRTLRRELQRARGTLAEGEAAVQENAQLRAIAGLPFIGGLRPVTAQVIGDSPGNFDVAVQLDKGTSAGIRAGMPVVASAGLVGHVINTSRTRSTVQLVTDPDAGVGVRLSATGVPGVAVGRPGSSTMDLQLIDTSVPVKQGDLVVTAGLQGAAYPAGIPVARVSAVSKSPEDVRQRIELTPLEDVSKVQFVQVLDWLPSSTVP